MSSRDDMTLPAARPKSRKSLGAMPSSSNKENMTTDIAALMGAKHKRDAHADRPAKKSRSKSIGPGGLDALNDTSGNRRRSIAIPPPRSILKTRLDPLPEIPTRRASPKKATQAAPDHEDPFSVPETPAVANTRVALRTEEEQQAAAREREAKEKEEAQKTETARREARRKSLAARRVSFAPEATLHTWDVVEYMQDSTTSSAATDSTRRASMSQGSASPQTPQAHFGSDASEPPSTPPEQIEEDTATQSPAHQRDLHQKKRRRSSGIPPLNFNNPDDEFFSSSPFSGSSEAGEEVESDEDSDEGSDNGDTAMSLDMGDATDMSMASVKSFASDNSSARLDKALQLAAQQAGTQGIDFDENGPGIPDEEEEEEIVASFAPWKKASRPSDDQENINPFAAGNDDATMTMEMTRAVGGILQAALPDQTDDEMTMEMTMDMTMAMGQIIPDQLKQQDSEADEDDEVEDQTMEVTMDATRAFGRILPSQPAPQLEQTDDEMTMDMTMAIGGILPQQAPAQKRRKSVAPSRRQSTRRQSLANAQDDDATMDFTMAIGGIQQPQRKPSPLDEDMDQDEEMTMEFTSVVGGVLAAGRETRRQSAARRQSAMSNVSEINESGMEMTMAVGKILSSPGAATPQAAKEVTYPNLDAALASTPQAQTTAPARTPMLGLESNAAEPPPIAGPAGPNPMAATATESGSPAVNPFRGKNLRRSTNLRTSTTPKGDPPSAKSVKATPTSPIQKPTTPSKQLTPRPARPESPNGKTPPSKNVSMRIGSPMRLFAAEIKAAKTTPKSTPQSAAKKTLTPKQLFQKDDKSGVMTPSIMLQHRSRRSSGLGVDKAGLGSPRVAAIMDRRQSLGDAALAFEPGTLGSPNRKLRFGDAQIIEQELDKEREEDLNAEDGRKIMEREADQGDDRDATLNLKEMIQSMTPKKNPLKGRKSLAVGAAKGLLGKRPLELDEDEDDEDEGGTKRLKDFEGSPVKNIKLAAPPTKEETTGRLTRSTRKSLEANTTKATPVIFNSPAKSGATSPKAHGRFKDVPEAPIPLAAGHSAQEELAIPDLEANAPKMHLQDFLNMTSIRFMELTTTKRRHTIAPAKLGENADSEPDVSLEAQVVAGACTLPMLELFQHSCRELKKYISEGRKVVKEIETETWEENPLIFQEYAGASVEMRNMMDRQFLNVKTHARLLSKGMWYEWRMKLLEGLKAGLVKNAEGMAEDEVKLARRQALLDQVFPQMEAQWKALKEEEEQLKSAAEEIAQDSPEDLADARECLIAVDAGIEAKKAQIAALRTQIEAQDAKAAELTAKKAACLEDIKQAEKIREECRGWTSNEVAALKARVDALEKAYGWTITGVTGSTISMAFRGDLELVFDASSFKSAAVPRPSIENSRIDLWYIAGTRAVDPVPETPEKKFFVDAIRDLIRGFVQAETSVKELLDAISSAWARSLQVLENIKSLGRRCPMVVDKTSDYSVAVEAMLLLVPLQSKVRIRYSVDAKPGSAGLELGVVPEVRVVYGEKFNEDNMGKFLGKQEADGLGWGTAVEDLGKRLLARGRK